MTEITPLLKEKCIDLLHNVAFETEGEEEKPPEYECESEIPLLEIVVALCKEWQRNGANEDFTPQDIMAMHIQYRRVTYGCHVLPTPHVIINELADAMLPCIRQTHFYNGDPYMVGERHRILKSLKENWTSIIKFDEDLARDLNVYHPPPYRVRIRNAWMNFRRKFTDLQSCLSDFTFQFILGIILLSWPLSVLVMGGKFMSQCPIDSFLPSVMVAAGVLGISALLLRLTIISIEKFFWWSMRTQIPNLRIALKFVEFVFLLFLAIQLWFSFGHFPNFENKLHDFCNETFYTFTFWMKHIYTPVAMVWIVAYFVKAVLWIKRIRYHYMPPFYDDTVMNSYTEI